MAIVISCINEKGGVAKTSTAVELAAVLAREHGKSVVLVDMDGQSNATSLLLGSIPEAPTLADLLFKTEGVSLSDVLKPSLPHWGDIGVLPADPRLVKADRYIVGKPRSESRLALALKPLLPMVDYIFVDLPPALNHIAVNGLVASTHYLMPASIGKHAVRGVREVQKLVRELQDDELCQGIQCLGALVTMFQKGIAIGARTFLEDLADAIPDNPLAAIRIPHSTRLVDAHYQRQPITVYDPENPVSVAYRKVAQLILERTARPTPEKPAPTTETVNKEDAP